MQNDEMNRDDLSRLKIDRAAPARRPRRRWVRYGIGAAVAAGVLAVVAGSSPRSPPPTSRPSPTSRSASP
jgi:ferric-dicitrate binding protein FerR (iron transport regulator)